MEHLGLRKLFWKINDTRYNAIQLAKIKKNYSIRVMSSLDTIEYIKEHNCSISRYGNDELDIAMGQTLESFQNCTPELTEKLSQVLKEKHNGLLICMPRYFINLSGCKKASKKYWNGWKIGHQAKMVTFLKNTVGEDYVYGDSEVTRPYIDYKSPKNAQKVFPALKTLWSDKDLLIVEGEKTRLGIGNDLFAEARSIKRMLCPAQNAFDYYDTILSAVKEKWNGELVLLALGATATVLAFDLSKSNIQALDVGHVDIEYEWMKMGAKWKCAIPGKYTNEVEKGRKPIECKDEEYCSQIIWTYQKIKK